MSTSTKVFCLAVLAAFASGCPDERPHAEPRTDEGSASGFQPNTGSVAPAAGASSDEGGDASTESQTPAAEVTCDGACETDDDCTGGETCVSFEVGFKCAPPSCDDCEIGCVYDLNDCSFRRCLGDGTDVDDDTCGRVCESDEECGAGLACVDVFGLGECAPVECRNCNGLCDYLLDGCDYQACYMDDGRQNQPVYCPHLR